MDKLAISVGLDVGSSRTRCLVGALEQGRLRFLGYGESASYGWSRSRIADQEAVAEAVKRAVVEAEKNAGVSAEACVAGMGGSTIMGLNNRGLYEMGRPREIADVDMRYAVSLAAQLHLPADRMVLQLCPQDFAVDGRAEYRSAKGAVGSRLESFVHVITVSTQEHQALVGAINMAHVAVEETIFEPVAAAYAAVLPEEREEGIALVDIGAHSTDLALYYGDALITAATLPIGGDHFTRDVAHGLCVSFEDAQRVKEECGCAMLGLTADNSLIEVPSAQGRPAREATRRDLNVILEARAEELFLYVRREISRVNMEQALINGVVLAGAAASMPGMCDMAERVLNCQARNGLAVGIADWPAELDAPAWTTAAGLMMYSARLKFLTGKGVRDGGFLSRFFRRDF